MSSEGSDRPRRTLGTAFDPSSNSLNLLRLLLAGLVLLGHSTVVYDFGPSENIRDRTSIATLGIFGFFAISGFLIAGSAARSRPWPYLRKRILRIFPGFWAALIVVALVIAAVSWHFAPGIADCDLGCYYRIGQDGPWSYIWRNLTLWINQPGIAKTPHDYIFFGWNLPLWSLVYEFGCYLLLLLLAIVGVLKRSWLVALLAAAVWAVEIGCMLMPSSVQSINLLTAPVLLHSLTLAPIFLVGSALWALRDRIPDSPWIAAACTAGFVASLWVPLGPTAATAALSTASVAAPLLVYPVLWLGFHLPFTHIGRRNDYSYGVYIYAYPLQLLLVAVGATGLGLIGFNLVTIALTAVFAFASWHLIEKRSIALAHRRSGSDRAPVEAAPEEPQPV